jgi:hypothetical protein
MSTIEQQAKAPQDLRNVVNFLRTSKAGMKIRVGVLNGKRIDYFKGKQIFLYSTYIVTFSIQECTPDDVLYS